MNTPYDGGPAFPPACPDTAHTYALSKLEGVTDSNERDRIYIQAKAQAATGMSLRDWFAGHESLADCADISPRAIEALIGRPMAKFADDPIQYLRDEAEGLANLKFLRADAMLAARERKPEATK